MTIEDIRDKVWYSKEYKFLQDNEHLGYHIILLGLGGSYGYGTNTEKSDIDIRGCALNTKKDILTYRDFEQVTDNPTDTTIYSFDKLIKLLIDVNPNTIELLGLEDWQYIHLTDIGKELLNNKKLFLSKKCIHSFGGYANSQLYRLKNISAHEMSQDGLEQHILKTLEFMQSDFSKKYSNIKDDSLRLYIDKSDRDDMDTEIFMDVNLTHYPVRDYAGLYNELKTTVSQYNKIGKHMMHLVRLYLMCFDILEKGEINTYRKNDINTLMEIRNGKYITEDNQVLPEFFEMVNDLEKRLSYDSENTSLPEKPISASPDNTEAVTLSAPGVRIRSISIPKSSKYPSPIAAYCGA